MRADRRSPVRLDDPAQVLVDAGLVDAAYVTAQLGVPFDSRLEAARAVVRAGDVSPHPLFESQWVGRRRSWQRSGQHPVVWYVSERRRRNRLAPHPLVDPRVIFAAYPEARLHDYGALSYWLSVSGPTTPLPTRILPRKVTWGTYRRAAIEAATAWREEVIVERPQLLLPTGSLPTSLSADPTSPVVTVVMSTQDDGPIVRSSIVSLQGQTVRDWHLVVVDRGSSDDTVAVLRGSAAFDPRITVVPETRCGQGRALNVALEHVTSEHVAFLPPGREWTPDLLAGLLTEAHSRGAALVLVGSGSVARDRGELLGGRGVDLATSLLRRDAIKDAGGFDESLGGAVERDLVLRLTRDHAPTPVDVPIVRRPEPTPPGYGDDWDSVVLERQLVDWEAAASRTLDEQLVTYVLPLSIEPRRTVEWLSAMPREGVEIITVGIGLRRAHHVLAASIASVVSGARFVSIPADVSTPAATNLGITHAAGATVILVRAEAMPPRQPIAERLAEVVAQPDVALAQPLIVDLDGVILSAGARFSPGHPHPELFLAGLPTSDARRIGPYAVAAPAAPLVALRTSTAIALKGLSSRFHSVLAETDLGLRAYAAGFGRSVVIPDAVITSRTPYAGPDEFIGALTSLRRETVLTPPDDAAALLRTAGFEVLAQRNRRVTADPEDPLSTAVLVPELVVRPVFGIDESPPRLRWAIDIAAPAAARGDRWGDTYFARSLAEAMERRGQHVAVDRRDARDRDSRDFDDVLLVLRGLDRVAPRPGLLNVEWIISHPDMIVPEEVVGFDAVYAASTSWAARMSREWGLPIDPLLQCTDVRWFHPDRAEPDTGPRLLFVGNSRGVYRYAVRSAVAIGADLTLHGNDWTEFVDRERITSGGVANEEVGELYASASIVLNDHHIDMRRDSFASNRLFDAAACGARILTDRIDGIEETFGGLVVPFDNEHELARLVTPPYDAFPDNATRREIATRVVAEHSFDQRAETLVDDAVRRLLARRG